MKMLGRDAFSGPGLCSAWCPCCGGQAFIVALLCALSGMTGRGVLHPCPVRSWAGSQGLAVPWSLPQDSFLLCVLAAVRHLPHDCTTTQTKKQWEMVTPSMPGIVLRGLAHVIKPSQ